MCSTSFLVYDRRRCVLLTIVSFLFRYGCKIALSKNMPTKLNRCTLIKIIRSFFESALHKFLSPRLATCESAFYKFLSPRFISPVQSAFYKSVQSASSPYNMPQEIKECVLDTIIISESVIKSGMC